MKIVKANRSKSFVRLGLSGPAGCGKTYSSLLIAKGLVGSLSNVVLIDSENGSGHLYAHLGTYNVIALDNSFSPSKYIKAIKLAIDNGATCIIIDSLSHAWESVVNLHHQMSGNSFKNWGIVKSQFNELIQEILSSNVHIIATFRTKSDYIITTADGGKMLPKKVGLKSITSDGTDYEFTLLFDLDLDHNANVSKDRTELFKGKRNFKLDELTGRSLLLWCNSDHLEDTRNQIRASNTIVKLTELYQANKEMYPLLKDDFDKQRAKINQTIIKQTKISENGIHR